MEGGRGRMEKSLDAKLDQAITCSRGRRHMIYAQPGSAAALWWIFQQE